MRLLDIDRRILKSNNGLGNPCFSLGKSHLRLDDCNVGRVDGAFRSLGVNSKIGGGGSRSE